jgi:hypothetical protein
MAHHNTIKANSYNSLWNKGGKMNNFINILFFAFTGINEDVI